MYVLGQTNTSIQLSSAVSRISSSGGCENPTDFPRSRTALKSANTAYDGMDHNLQRIYPCNRGVN